ncbi:MAG: CtsR family transcriptional regulator [Acholeplasmataceae bacterium]|nr:CtsR family transcriptional regulator [Acholeplasmataceae bacterium]
MKNLADDIENFIVRQLLLDEEDQILVQRNELADRLSCAPSQISYVLSTRFTPERGYIVESRRGSGGFVRIVRLMAGELQQRETSSGQRENKIRQLAKANGITYREAVLLAFMMEVLEGKVDPRERGAIFTEALGRLARTKNED